MLTDLIRAPLGALLFVITVLSAASAQSADTTLAISTHGSGTPVIIVPGILGSQYSFRKVIPGLVEDNFRVSVIDPMGYGASPRPEHADYSYTAQAARIAQTMSAKGIRNAILVCHAVGGSICYRLALHHPELVRGIVSINGGPSEQGGTAKTRLALKFAKIVLKLRGRDYAIKQVKNGMINGSYDPSWVTDDVVAKYVEPFGPDVRVVIKSLQQIANSKEPELIVPNLPNIKAPVRLLYGTGPRGKNEPPIPVAERAQLRAGLKHYEETEVPNTGSVTQEEAPAAVVAAVKKMRDQTH